MPLIIELGVVFAIAFVLSAIWQKLRGQPWAAALHRGFVLAIVVMLVYFLLLVVSDMLNLRPEPPAAGGGAG